MRCWAAAQGRAAPRACRAQSLWHRDLMTCFTWKHLKKTGLNRGSRNMGVSATRAVRISLTLTEKHDMRIKFNLRLYMRAQIQPNPQEHHAHAVDAIMYDTM